VFQKKEKNMYRTVLTTFLWLALACCVGSDAGNQRASAQPPFPQDVPSDTLITLTRTDCFGGCPTYTLSINAEGKVLFDGRKDVKQTGEVESRISHEKLKELIAAFKKINYFDLQWRYDHGIACPQFSYDSPAAITSLTLNGKKKTIHHANGCTGSKELAQLTWLEGKIDEAVKVDQWLK
jgi:Domain of unknown function (DUF6438)